ncbi:136aa long hypothetical protein [Pyrococcus horikoshii OT3]|uniref:Uncharacterized protein n=1 Tax=Pyrococcus horikoshii (strain ATCC 700860 / DSM 12428 / JCM 9974 / NBRC 100139 / OT-3) TaxID=70601 RepID=O59203_PYRHO|nr:136aa long hypothetical protein [Pyrococcus horikoshii OT3]
MLPNTAPRRTKDDKPEYPPIIAIPTPVETAIHPSFSLLHWASNIDPSNIRPSSIDKIIGFTPVQTSPLGTTMHASLSMGGFTILITNPLRYRMIPSTFILILLVNEHVSKLPHVKFPLCRVNFIFKSFPNLIILRN